MDKVIVTVLLIIGGVVAAFAIMNGVYPAIQRSSSAINTATDQVNDQIKSQIEIINISTNGTNVQIWVKNVGASVINSVENSDVFLYSGSTIERLVTATKTRLCLIGITAWQETVHTGALRLPVNLFYIRQLWREDLTRSR